MDETLARRVALRRVEDGTAVPEPRLVEYAGHNAFASDPVLTASLDAALDDETEDEFRDLGAYWGSVEAQEVARIAVQNRPTLRHLDDEGQRIDQVEMHPAYHALMNRSVSTGLLSSAWEDGEGNRQHRLRAALLMMTAGCERGHLTPMAATHAAIAALAYAQDLEAELFPLLASRRYDRRALPLEEKDGATVTFAIDERELTGERAALRTRGELSTGDKIRITGEKAFVLAPGSDLFLVLARTVDGPAAAIVPRFSLENAGAVFIDATSDAGGLGAQAAATVRFQEARGRIVGEPGRGLQVLRDVRTLSQLDATVIAAGGARAALARATHHLRTRVRAGTPLIADPLNARVIADMALTSASLTALSLRLATAFDQAFERDGDHAVARIATPAARVHALKAAIHLTEEARETLGTTALSASHPVSRIGPDLAVIARWDGLASDAAHDLVHIVARDEDVLADALEELGADLGNANADLIERVSSLGREATQNPGLARAFAEQLAMVTAASAMRRNLPRVVSDAYIASRLRGGYAGLYGTLDARFDAAALIDFIVPED